VRRRLPESRSRSPQAKDHAVNQLAQTPTLEDQFRIRDSTRLIGKG
jgi:hypothetical protein